MALHAGRNEGEGFRANSPAAIEKAAGGKTMRNDEREDGNRDVDWKKEGFVNQEL